MKSKIIIFCCMFFMFSCYKEDIAPLPKPVENIFLQTENQISDSDFLNFELASDGTYYLILQDVETNQVISKEKFIGVKGLNKLNIYTKSIQSRYLYLVLQDETKKEINKTKLVLK